MTCLGQSSRHFGGHELYSAEEWASAYTAAERELGLPPRGRRGSQANRVRMKRGTKLAQRAREILWLRRALGCTYGTGGANGES